MWRMPEKREQDAMNHGDRVVAGNIWVGTLQGKPPYHVRVSFAALGSNPQRE